MKKTLIILVAILILLVGFMWWEEHRPKGGVGKITQEDIERRDRVIEERRTQSREFYLHVGQSKSEIIGHINEPNETDVVVDARYGKIERCQWGSERVGTMVVIYFKDDRVIRFETKGKVR